MLTKINKIKRLGLVFSDFTWTTGTRAFKEVNLIYGWNGCGKTTLSRVFDAATRPQDVEVDFEFLDGSQIAASDPFPHPVRVFNQDYIQENVSVLTSKAKTISIVLGAENKELIEKIEADERKLNLNADPTDPSKPGLLHELRSYKQKLERKSKENEKDFTDIARTISAEIGSSGAASRTYRSPEAKADFDKLQAPVEMSEDEIGRHRLALKQDMMDALVRIHDPTQSSGGQESIHALLGVQVESARTLLSRSAVSETIDRLASQPEISAWVEQGIHIHESYKSSSCEYCGNNISPERLALLGKHFSDADRQLKADIDALLANVRQGYARIQAYSWPDLARLYKDLQPEYGPATAALESAKIALLASIEVFGKVLLDKKNRTSESISTELQLSPDAFEAAVAAVNEIIEKHSQRTGNFLQVQEEAISALKNYHLSTIYPDVTLKREAIKLLTDDLAARETEISGLQKGIAIARAAVSSNHKACESINAGITTFLGRDELSFVPETASVDDGAGGKRDEIVSYQIMRGSQPAMLLSEGEKTAIAFVYFVVHLQDGQFSKANGVVVIDDPISSLDSNSAYQAFSFLKNAVIGCKQVFILTHNFEFLKLLLNWRSREQARTAYYMIKNSFVGNDRRAALLVMDKELREYESEYHYLFKCLKEMRANQDGSIMRAYPVPNIARKVWDAFLMYRVPDGRKTYSKMDTLKNEGIDPQKLDAIYKFTNDNSHITGSGFDPSLVPETQKVLTEVFEMMEKIAPEHFKVLDAATPI